VSRPKKKKRARIYAVTGNAYVRQLDASPLTHNAQRVMTTGEPAGGRVSSYGKGALAPLVPEDHKACTGCGGTKSTFRQASRLRRALRKVLRAREGYLEAIEGLKSHNRLSELEVCRLRASEARLKLEVSARRDDERALSEALAETRRVVNLQARAIRILTGEHDPRPSAREFTEQHRAYSSVQQDPELTGRWSLAELATEAALKAAREGDA